MSYQVLARKWRPQNFSQVVGQEHVVRALTQALTDQRLHHAYLFTGTRGVGKTTLARILAKSLNCLEGISATPCGTCQHCTQIAEGRFVDLIEVDAASKTKVEDTRELLDNVQYTPTQGRYKIYLIDEVHMLSGHSFNALLKTLEEPPEYVKFLLATTEIDKLPITVLSRCLQFHLKAVPVEVIEQHLTHILTEEGLNFEALALKLLAQAAKGSVRDSLSLLEQGISYSNSQLTTTDIQSMLGTVEKKYILGLLDGLCEHSGDKLLAASQDVSELGLDYTQVLSELINALHQLAWQQQFNELPESLFSYMLVDYLERFSPEDVQLFYQIALTGIKDMPLVPEPRIGFEMTLLRMLAFYPGPGGGQPVKKPQQEVKTEQPAESAEIVTKIPNEAPIVSVAPEQTDAPPLEPLITEPPLIEITAKTAALPEEADSGPASLPEVVEETAEAPVSEDSSSVVALSESELVDLKENWRSVIAKLSLGGVTKTLAEHCVVKSQTDHTLELTMAARFQPMLSKTQEQQIAEALSEAMGRKMNVQIQPGEVTEDTPHELAQKEHQEALCEAIESLKTDTVVQTMITSFDATLDEDSVVIKS